MDAKGESRCIRTKRTVASTLFPLNDVPALRGWPATIAHMPPGDPRRERVGEGKDDL